MEDEEYTTGIVESVADVGSLVRYQREHRGWTQAELARRARVGRRLVTEIENGKGTIQFDSLMRVCLAVDLELIVKGEVHALQRKPLRPPAHVRSARMPGPNEYARLYDAAIARFGKNNFGREQG